MNIRFKDNFHPTILTTPGNAIALNNDLQSKNSNTKRSSSSNSRRVKKPHIIIDITTPKLSRSPTTKHERAVLVEASLSNFGYECLRLVNIVFETSQTFPCIMGTCGSISQYIRKELSRKYPSDYFHIIIGQNNAFGFAIDDDEYFAEIEQEQYRVIVFSTSRNSTTKLEIHDANSQMMLQWKTLSVKKSEK